LGLAMRKVLYNSHADEALYRMLREAAAARFDVLTLEADSDAERKAKLASADAVIVASKPLTEPLIAAAHKLEFVHHQGVGYHDTVHVPSLIKRKIPLAITPGGTTVPVAEHTVLLILSVLRRLPFADAELRAGRFHINALRPVSRELSGRTIGLVGLGRIGRAVAERLRPFDVTLLYYDPIKLTHEEEKALGLERQEMSSLLSRSDIVSLHLPVTSSTHHIMDASAFQQMREGSFLVNTARGGLVDEAALIAALESGRLAGAALDVFDPEPPMESNPLLQMPNVVLTPHISAGTRDAFMTKMDAVFRNLQRFWNGEPVENLVEFEQPSARVA
jgi:phosphoglycerate dehydrogenase-like enzyme